ncbi:hypothetical protein [Zoogloea sp.]|uniref:hypothetical protein n=1 Tax=Zoogloea sp. TaxID=49181 RepID=UPI001ACEEED8|nr:hypothetical protein [Zoogloea sp.]MBN8283756.1 hypothetical protein [Zoogloea sp.]
MAIRIPPSKTPTAGTLLTSARNVADEWYQPTPAKQGPQWRLWANLPAVELWQAITLSCGIEPKYYLGDADPEFELRMRIAIGNGLGKGDRPHCALVTLRDVARLAHRCGWTLPPEFPQPVVEQPSIAGVKLSPEEVEHGDVGMVATPAAERPARADDGAQALSKAEEILANEPYQSAPVDAVPTARSNPLTSVITKARSSALNAEDPSSVWAELVKMAESPNRPGPLIGYAEGEGIKYQTEKGVQFLTRKNFGDREMRARKRASAR